MHMLFGETKLPSEGFDFRPVPIKMGIEHDIKG